jgi:hypothetical protein
MRCLKRCTRRSALGAGRGYAATPGCRRRPRRSGLAAQAPRSMRRVHFELRCFVGSVERQRRRAPTSTMDRTVATSAEAGALRQFVRRPARRRRGERSDQIGAECQTLRRTLRIPLWGLGTVVIAAGVVGVAVDVTAPNSHVAADYFPTIAQVLPVIALALLVEFGLTTAGLMRAASAPFEMVEHFCPGDGRTISDRSHGPLNTAPSRPRAATPRRHRPRR